MFEWGVSKLLIPVSTFEALKTDFPYATATKIVSILGVPPIL